MSISHDALRNISVVGVVAILALAAFLGFGGYKYVGVTTELEKTLQQLAETEQDAEILQDHLDATEEELRQEKAKMDAFAKQVEEITGAVGILQQLQGTDRELLQKYSRTYFLSENYVPSQLAFIQKRHTYNSVDSQQIHAQVKPFLERMLDAAISVGNEMMVVSAYRSAYEQSQVNSRYNVLYGKGANTFSAEQGYSEHQLGTTADLTTPEIGSTFTDFEKTGAYTWLLQNAYQYGFVLSYPKDNPYYIFEPWHWRFVGVEFAALLHDQNRNFYDLDQEEINQYLLDIFD